MTEIVYGEFPPNFDFIRAHFPLAGKRTVFSYGDKIYVPSGIKLSPAIHAHELVHCGRQLELGLAIWWEKYVTDVHFRYWEELLAHRAEYQHLIKDAPGRPWRRKALSEIARKLSHPLYGPMVTFNQAKKAIVA